MEQLEPIETLFPITQSADMCVNSPLSKPTPIVPFSINFLSLSYIKLIAFNMPSLALLTLTKEISVLEDSLKSFFTIRAEHLVLKYSLI